MKAAHVDGHISLIGVLTGRAGDVPTAMLIFPQTKGRLDCSGVHPVSTLELFRV